MAAPTDTRIVVADDTCSTASCVRGTLSSLPPIDLVGTAVNGRDPQELRKVLAAIGARVVDGEVAIGHVMNRFDEDGRLNDPNLEEEMREIIRDLLAEIDDRSPEPDTLAAA